VSTTEQSALYGKPVEHEALASGEYNSPEEYADQGDERVVRDLVFSYLVAVTDAAGNEVLTPQDVSRDTTVTVEQIGLVALEKGEKYHSFYTSDELKRIQSGGRAESGDATGTETVSELGEYELAEWLAGEAEGQTKAPTQAEVLEEVGDDKDLAHRMLQAENIRADGDPRKGLEVGLTRIIQG
jgi:hypothetical protein